VAATGHLGKLWFVSFGSYVRCGKNKVSVTEIHERYVESTPVIRSEAMELDEAWCSRGRQTLAVTEDGRVYVSFRASGSEGLPLSRSIPNQNGSGNPSPIATGLLR